MADLQELLSSISDEDMAKIKSVADSIMNNNQKSETPQKNPSPLSSLPIDDGIMQKLVSVMGQLNKEDTRTRLITDLKPLLSEERRKKAVCCPGERTQMDRKQFVLCRL